MVARHGRQAEGIAFDRPDQKGGGPAPDRHDLTAGADQAGPPAKPTRRIARPAAVTRRGATAAARRAAAHKALRLLCVAVVVVGLYALGALLPFWYLESPTAGAA